MQQALLKVVFLVALFRGPAALAQSLNDASVEALASEARMQTVTVSDNTFWIAIITGAILLMSLSNALSGSAIGRPSARNLFLSVTVRPASGDREQTAWIRALDTHSALLVSPKVLTKGDSVRIDLSVLPGYPTGEDAHWVDAVVKRVRSLGGNPATFEARIKFPRLKMSVRTFLADYLRSLSGPSKIRHA